MNIFAIAFQSVDDGLPSKSGDYVCRCIPSGAICTCEYSAKHKAFNVNDNSTDEEIEKYKIDVSHWAFEPNV